MKNLLNNSLIILLYLFFIVVSTANAQENPLSGFDNLIGKTWKAEGTWADGSIFKQELNFKRSLEGKAIITEAKGFINEAQTDYGHRNHGLRKYDTESETIQFWEFDVFGGVTQGTVVFNEKDILYQYNYGGSLVTDFWEYVDSKTYNFKVGSYADGKWQKIYLETQFKAVDDFNFYFDHKSIVVTELIETGDFYRDVLKLKEISHPDKKPGFRWFQIRGNSQLHLIKKDVVESKKDKSTHLCVSTQNLEGVIAHLMENNIDFYDWPGTKGSVTNRSDGVQQIYLKDPDGYWIEINTAKH